MSSVTDIKRAQIAARLDFMKTKNPTSEIKALLLSSFIGDIEKQQKNYKRELSTLEIVQLVKQYIKNITETEKVAGISNKTSIERDVLMGFLPPQKTQEELKQLIDQLCVQVNATSIKEFGKVFGALRKDHDGTYDNEFASTYIKSKLEG